MTIAIRYGIQDEKGDTSVLTFHVNDTLTITQLQELNISIQNLLKDGAAPELLLGGIVTAGAVLNLPVQVGKEVVNDLSRVEYGALFDFLVTGGFHTSFRLPTFNEAFVVDGGRDVDQTATEVAALINAVINGIAVTGGTALFQDYRGTDITSISSAAEDSKRQRK